VFAGVRTVSTQNRREAPEADAPVRFSALRALISDADSNRHHLNGDLFCFTDMIPGERGWLKGAVYRRRDSCNTAY
jgi:hypothetical protein